MISLLEFMLSFAQQARKDQSEGSNASQPVDDTGGLKSSTEGVGSGTGLVY